MKFRKLMAVALVAAMAATMAVGCGGSSSDKSAEGSADNSTQTAEVISIHQTTLQSYPVKMDPVQEELSLNCSESKKNSRRNERLI